MCNDRMKEVYHKKVSFDGNAVLWYQSKERISIRKFLMLQRENMLTKMLSSCGTEMVDEETVFRWIWYFNRASKHVIHSMSYIQYLASRSCSLPLHFILLAGQPILAALLPNCTQRIYCLLPKADSNSLTKFDVVLLPNIESPTAKGLWSGANRSILRFDFAQFRAVARTLSPRSLK